MIIPQRQYDIGYGIDRYVHTGLNYREIHDKYYKDISYECVLDYHKLYLEIFEILCMCKDDSDYIYNVNLDLKTLKWISKDAGTTKISKISPQFLIDLNTHWRKVTNVEYIRIRHAFAPYFGYPEYHITKVTKILQYSLSDITQWFNQYQDVCKGMTVSEICAKYNIKPYILQANMRRWAWLAPAIKAATLNDSAIESLNISSRYYKVLRNNGIKSIEQLEDTSETELKKLKGIKDFAVRSIRTAISEHRKQF